MDKEKMWKKMVSYAIRPTWIWFRSPRSGFLVKWGMKSMFLLLLCVFTSIFFFRQPHCWHQCFYISSSSFIFQCLFLSFSSFCYLIYIKYISFFLPPGNFLKACESFNEHIWCLNHIMMCLLRFYNHYWR